MDSAGASRQQHKAKNHNKKWHDKKKNWKRQKGHDGHDLEREADGWNKN